ncbi:tyramine receptor Ser-2 isoform X2 [Nematostella vectensis]|uniref:tyramine receptor Ser-2 isoform X2 n=1 Tax=Nematostella vectensis TaxID=45351 RepID=UPI0013906081|nr:tyramine receptor Ser-2 isoform X2 [Nematostella vectensis]
MSVNSGNTLNHTSPPPKVGSSSGLLVTLPLLSAFILIGNLTILLSINTFNIRRVPDSLISALATVDLLNNILPVWTTLAVLNLDKRGFKGLDNKPFCQFYNWSATWLRLSASFIASLMALDRFLAIAYPFFYRTTASTSLAIKFVCGATMSAAFLAAWPVMGCGEVKPFRGVCSFEFTGSYAYVVAIIGYFQLVLVLLCFVSVARKIKQHVSQLHAMRLGHAFTLHGGNLTLDQSSASNQEISQSQGSDRNINHDNKNAHVIRLGHASTQRSGLTLDQSSAKIQSNSLSNSGGEKSQNGGKNIRQSQSKGCTRPQAPRHAGEGVHEKSSRQFVKVLAVVVFLFYLSWMPIIFSITVALQTRREDENLHTLSAMMSLIGSILNPVVYGVMCKPYRIGYRRVFMRIFCCKKTLTQPGTRRIQVT